MIDPCFTADPAIGAVRARERRLPRGVTNIVKNHSLFSRKRIY